MNLQPVAACDWTPAAIVSLVEALAWPATVLVACLLALFLIWSTGLWEAGKRFLSRNSLKEITAGPSGVNAKFESITQTSEPSMTGGVSVEFIPETSSLEFIRKTHNDFETPLSNELYLGVRHHIKSLNLSQAEAIELLSKDISLLQSAIRFYDINKAIFFSQYKLLDEVLSEDKPTPILEIRNYFSRAKESARDALEGWNFEKYIGFLLSARLILEEPPGYKLSKIGVSYLKFMRKNLQLVDELRKT